MAVENDVAAVESDLADIGLELQSIDGDTSGLRRDLPRQFDAGEADAIAIEFRRGGFQSIDGEGTARGEIIGFPSLEVYGHSCEDPSKTETTILIGLQQQAQ